ncbi:uncharacterized protein LOC132613118 [Lycium barbarum]|uniref:uncharacterized protein LOC132613118 n=1 Tax=Lycium barbarum TaxID=112863 RepID=UPI00293F6359|nr:uncharacterized protein LOC132613118 [Lycium barbarum]
MNTTGHNCNGKIWYFVNDGVDVEILMDTEQQITIKLCLQNNGKSFINTLVYVKCDAAERLQLWDDIYNLANHNNLPWLIGGYFNVIMNEEEKIGGLPVYPAEYEDFAFCVNSCELSEVEFRGSPFTWWNGRAGHDCIFKRLDRILVNQQFQDWLGNMSMEHLSRTRSEHAPLLLSASDQSQEYHKQFRFLKFWLEHETFMQIVEQHWKTEYVGDSFITFKLKMKNLKTALSAWSRETFGDVFKQLTIREDIVKIKEQLFEEDPSEENRIVLQRAQAEFKKYLHFEEEFWKQKSGIQKETELVAAEAIAFYKDQFTREQTSTDLSLLEHVPRRISDEQNATRCAILSLEEIKNAVLHYQEIVLVVQIDFLEFSIKSVGI